MSDTENLITAIHRDPVGTYRLYRATDCEPEVEQAMSNLSELTQRILHARSVGCLVEVISMRMQYLDMWLRIYFENTTHQAQREREFGRLLRQCFEGGLDKNLYDKLLAFNKDRIAAIHGFLVGSIAYSSLAAVVAQSDGLSEDLAEFVLLNSGEVVTTEFEIQWHNRGDMVRHIPSSIALLRNRDPL